MTGAWPEPRGRVARILARSCVDGPGSRCAVFLQGCDFDCAYCHNPETRPSVAASRERRPDGSPAWPRLMSASEVLAELGGALGFVRGATVSGGECGLQGDFLLALVRAFREAGLPTLVDTNGSTDYASRPRLVAEAEGFMLDVKAWDEGEHRALTGAGNRTVLENLRFLARSGKLREVRTVVVPGAFDVRGTVEACARTLAECGSGAAYKLIAFRPQGVRRSRQPLARPDPGLMEELAALARAAGAAEAVVV